MDFDWKLWDELNPELAEPGPPTQEDIENDCKKRLFSIIYSYGLDLTLSKLILLLEESNSDGKAPYSTDAADGIKGVLEEYRKRYEKYPLK